MVPKLIAFDLDGTLLRTDKSLSPANRAALQEMNQNGTTVALASGRFGSSMMPYAQSLDFNPAMLTLNGAAVFTCNLDPSTQIYHAPLDVTYAQELIRFAEGKPMALNFYVDSDLYCLRNQHNQEWIDLYYQQTQTPYREVTDLKDLSHRAPSKLIYIAAPETLDPIQDHFRTLWQDQVYICRTWDYYLEFLNIQANKAQGLTLLAQALNIDMNEVAAFGDAENDIPMLQAAGLGIAMQNAPDEVKQHARHISPWTNDQDGIAREWERIKSA